MTISKPEKTDRKADGWQVLPLLLQRQTRDNARRSCWACNAANYDRTFMDEHPVVGWIYDITVKKDKSFSALMGLCRNCLARLSQQVNMALFEERGTTADKAALEAFRAVVDHVLTPGGVGKLRKGQLVADLVELVRAEAIAEGRREVIEELRQARKENAAARQAEAAPIEKEVPVPA